MTGGAVDTGPTPPERFRRARWVLALAVLGGVVFTAGLQVQVRCAVGDCAASGLRRLFALDGLGALPRTFTTAVFLAVAVLAGVAAARSRGVGAPTWWTALAAAGLVLAAAKALSTHSVLERDDGRSATLLLGALVTVVGLWLLWRAGRRWSVPGAGMVTVALAAYAVAALGLDQVTAAVRGASGSPVVRAVATYLEEGGEAVTALVLLAAVAQWVPHRGRAGRSS